jgi:hypothetical protein
MTARYLAANWSITRATIPQIRTVTGIFVLLAACIYPVQSYANRPAMADEGPAEEVEAAPESAAPSAVEVMMQQQQHRKQTGDVLELPPKEIQPGEVLQVEVLDIPRRGASMSKVKQQLGEPLSISDSVGDPPITRWVYSDRIVYFEYSSVLHVVARN